VISFNDTSTLPTQDMLDAIARAPLGDDVFGLDPTVNELEAVAAGLMGKEAAVLMPSGTMANLAAVLSWTHPADEVVLEAEAHLLYYEAGGISAVAGCVPLGVPGDRGVLRAEEVERHLRHPDQHYPLTRLLCVENTHNRAGGTVTPVAVMKELRELCDAHQLALHVDGARIFNAAVALDIPAAELAADADSVFFALSKGLSAPVGAVLAGPAEFVGRARRARKMLGGGMRQAGIIAAAGLVALRTGIGRLRDDHEQARSLAAKLAALPGLTGLGYRCRRDGRRTGDPWHRRVVPAALHGSVRHPPADRGRRGGRPGGGGAGDQRPVSPAVARGRTAGRGAAVTGVPPGRYLARRAAE
jgi:threonine aldolase